MSHRVRTLVLLLIFSIACAAVQPSTSIRAAANRPTAASAAAESIELVARVGGPSYASAIDGSLLYINEGEILTIVDVSAPDQPVRRSSIQLPNRFGDIAALDGFVYLALDTFGLQIVDVRNPDQPVLRGRFQANTRIVQVQVQAGLAYITSVVDGFEIAQLHVVDISNPDLPVQRGKYRGATNILDVKIVGDLVYLSGGYMEGIHIIDASNPARLTLLGRYVDPARLAYSLNVVGNRIYALESIAFAEEPPERVAIIDTTDLSAPKLIGRYDLQDAEISGTHVQGSFMYLFELFGNIRIVDVSDPANPTLRGTYTTGARIYNPEVGNNLVYLQLGTDLAILDLSNPTAPTKRGSLVLSQTITSTQAVGDLVFSVAQQSGLHIFDLSQPNKPVLRGVYRDPDTTAARDLSNLVVRDNLAYVATETALKIIDVSNPASPTLRGEYKGLDGYPRIQVSGSRLYVSNFRTLNMFDIADPSQPTLLEQLPVSSLSILDFQIVGNLAYVLDGECSVCASWLQIMDISDPANIIALGKVRLYSLNQLSVVGSTAYVTGEGVQVIDVSDPTRPDIRYTYRAAGEVSAIEIVDGLMYASGRGGFSLHIADLTRPIYPRPRATYPLQGYSVDVHVTNDRAYVSAGDLLIFRIDPAQFPSSIFIPLLSRPE